MTDRNIYRVRDMYGWAVAWRTDVEDRPDLARMQDTQRAEFDAAIEEHIAFVLELAAKEAERGYLASESCDDIAARIRALGTNVEVGGQSDV